MYQELVYNLDLCILSYQLYSQTLVWPMDPYYEQMRKSLTSRRTNFIAEVHKNMEGLLPEKFGERFDPIAFNYDQINPWIDCYSKPESKWDVFSAPVEIVGKIKEVYFVKSGGGSPKKVATNPKGIEGKTDLLYCFEGKTGKIKDEGVTKNTDAMDSMLGFVLARDVAGNGGAYDVHIVFRGSRSGSGERAFVQGKFREKGNADWITDMDFGVLEKDDKISKIGRVCRGFKTSIKETKAAIIQCLEEIQKAKKKAPRQITITGHSLGGALSAHLASSLLLDVDDSTTAIKELKDWPFLSMKVHTFGSPVIGDRAFCDMLGSRIKITRCYSGGDPITQETFNFQGWPLTAQTHAGTMLPLPPFKNVSLESHEPTVIRRNLVCWLQDIDEDSDEVKKIPGSNYDEKEKEKYKDDGKPWQIREKLKDVVLLSNVKKMEKTFMPNFPDKYFEIYMGHMIETLKQKSSYSFGFKESKKNDKIKMLEDILGVKGDLRYNLKSMNIQLRAAKDIINEEKTWSLVGCLVLMRIFAAKPEKMAEIKKDGDTETLWKIMEKI